jgi:hypothetical protein
MSLITLIVVLVVVGIALYLINVYVPMDHKIKTILNIVIVVFVCIWLLQSLGVFGSLATVRIN